MQHEWLPWESKPMQCTCAFRAYLNLILGKLLPFNGELALCTPNFMVGRSDNKLMMRSSDNMVI